MDDGISSGAPHCCNCGVLFNRNPRLGDRPQRYCEKAGCQRARKAGWTRRKYASDPAFCAAEKKRVTISRHTPSAVTRDVSPAGDVGPPGIAAELLQLQVQLNEMGLLVKGMTSLNTGILDGDAVAICLERYVERGRSLQPGDA